MFSFEYYLSFYACIKFIIAHFPMFFNTCQPKRQGKGSLLLPCSKMPIGIFLFAQKIDFQKIEKNGEKRRKPEKISGFSIGIFFVKTHWRKIPEFRLWRIYLAFHDASRAGIGQKGGYANRIPCALRTWHGSLRA